MFMVQEASLVLHLPCSGERNPDMPLVSRVTDEVDLAARARTYFYDYERVVHGWEMRPHQRPWFSALQALADGRLRHPQAPACEACRRVEERWLRTAGLPYETGWRAYCGACRTTNKLMILAFFGSGKSDTLIAWLAWMLGRATVDGVIPQAGWVSYADDVASLRSVAIRDTIEFNDIFRFVFPTALPDKKKGWGESEWFLKRDDPGKKDQTLRAAGINGAILAYRFPTATIIDDPQDPKQMYSDAYKDGTWRTWSTEIRSRGAQDVTPVVVIGNRWAEDDIPGRMMESESGWQVIVTPAIAEGETVFPPEVVNGVPCGVSTDFLQELRDKQPRDFLMGYMCQPPSAEGGLLARIVRGARPAIQDVEKVVQFWDTATTKKTYSDCSAMVELWKLKNGRTFVNKVLNVRKGPAEVMDIMTEEYKLADGEVGNVTLAIEAAHAGEAYSDFLWRLSGLRVKLHRMEGHGKGTNIRGPRDLVDRTSAIVHYLDEGIVFLPNDTPSWYDPFVTQLRAQPSSPDDMVAALVGGIEFLYRRSWGRPVASFLPGRLIPRGAAYR